MSPEASDGLASVLALLGSPTRIALLRELRQPRQLHEIRVRVANDPNEPPMSRQSVRQHLDRLKDAAIVCPHQTTGSRGPTVQYSVNHLRLYEIAEELRALANLRPVQELVVQTAPQQNARVSESPRPCIVLVRGLSEGAAFRLPRKDGEGATIGRSRRADIVLDFDSFVSHEHCRIRVREDGHVVEDMASRNGTYVNFAPIPRGELRRIEHGDIIGVGRSLFTYWQ